MNDPRTADEEELEVVDAVPVVGPVAPPPEAHASPEPARSALAPVLASPVVQVAAVAATGFAVGAATIAVAKRRSARKLAPRRAGRSLAEGIVGSKSFLVDVHLLDR